jgi:hypothetical protein
LLSLLFCYCLSFRCTTLLSRVVIVLLLFFLLLLLLFCCCYYFVNIVVYLSGPQHLQKGQAGLRRRGRQTSQRHPEGPDQKRHRPHSSPHRQGGRASDGGTPQAKGRRQGTPGGGGPLVRRVQDEGQGPAHDGQDHEDDEGDEELSAIGYCDHQVNVIKSDNVITLTNGPFKQ